MNEPTQLANAPLSWLLQSDPAIQYQVRRDLLGEDRSDLRIRIAAEGWGKRLLDARRPDGHWGKGFYSPKWTSTHYTLLELKELGIMPEIPAMRASVEIVLANHKGTDGGIDPSRTRKFSDVCVTGMALNYASYFRAEEGELHSVVDFLLHEWMPDGGFNCHSNTVGAVHSSVHTTLSVLEGILEYSRNGYSYRLDELQEAAAASREFLLAHRLFRSHRTGAVIRPAFLGFHYPCRWYYDILRALVYFADAGIPYDARMQDAIGIITSKRKKDGTWRLASHHPGQQHFQMEEAGKPSRWITLRALWALKPYEGLEPS